MANYNWGNEFGPFREVQGEAGEGEGDVALRVNWEHVHHIHRAISMKLLEVVPAESLERIRELDVFIYQLSFPYTQVLLDGDGDGEGEVVAGLRKEYKDNDHPHLESDWAGVTGQWKISFCFCDHGHLIRFNKALRSLSSSPPDLNDPHYPPEAHKLSQAEVLRTMTVSLRITKVVQNPEFPGRPTLYFGGELDFGNGGGNSVMNGWVRVVDDSDFDSEDEGRGGRGRENAAIRWHFVSGETGNPIWSGEGVQIGGVKSAFGVLGSWTTIFHDIDDPVGPFWLRKQLDSEPEADD
ncbi:hypothetical protein V5O48_018777 [Marasmius crinis-equi]|uniref:Uncharacterized protein n=1 Tax=Marasmius crinis-equi TaxID=585013 RepID=A0ABR3EKB3_9AGAR